MTEDKTIGKNISKGKREWKPMQGDPVIWIIVLLLAVTSIVSVFSASSFLASSRGISKIDCLFDQLKSVALGLIALYVCYRIPLKFYRSISFILFALSLILLVLTFFIGAEVNGAVRGIRIGSHTIQVFEPAKVALVLYLARAAEVFKIDTFWDYCLKMLLPIVLVCSLIIVNSFSTSMLIAVLALLILLIIGIKPWYLLVTIGAGAAALVLLFGAYKALDKKRDDSGKSKVEKFFNRFGTAEDRINGFVSGSRNEINGRTKVLTQKELDDIRQSENAKIAISEGGIIGKGPGKSTQRYSLSMAFSDFIYAFIVEEYGLIGGILVLLFYLWFFYRCIIITKRCKTTYSSIVVMGLSLLIVIQAMLHILVNVRLIPITGHTLPLISHGGTAYLVLCGAFGIILSVSRTLDNTAQKKVEK